MLNVNVAQNVNTVPIYANKLPADIFALKISQGAGILYIKCIIPVGTNIKTTKQIKMFLIGCSANFFAILSNMLSIFSSF